jgi:hypothetical protein
LGPPAALAHLSKALDINQNSGPVVSPSRNKGVFWRNISIDIQTKQCNIKAPNKKPQNCRLFHEDLKELQMEPKMKAVFANSHIAPVSTLRSGYDVAKIYMAATMLNAMAK